MRAVDTNVLVRMIARDDERQAAAAEDFVAQGAWIPLLALAEALWVLKRNYGLNREALADIVAMMLEHRNLVLEQREVIARALALFREKTAISFSDCIILESATKAGHVPLGTFDRALSKVAGTHRL